MSAVKLAPEVIIAEVLGVKEIQVSRAIALLDEGATVPFIARYRKEVTGGLDDTQLRLLADRLQYLRELEERRQVILQSIEEQGKMTDELKSELFAAETKTRLEDLYLPYRPKRRTKAQIAREAGLEPLALTLLQDPSLNPLTEAAGYLNPEAQIESAEVALEGARQILMERFAEEATLLNTLREHLWAHGVMTSTLQADKVKEANNKQAAIQKYADYFNYQEPIKKIPSHRALALFRGRREGVLQVALVLPQTPDYGFETIAAYFNLHDKGRLADAWLKETAKQTWKIKLETKLELELFARLRELADDEAIKVFAKNLKDLLLAAPAGQKVTMGLDPGIRTGVKVVVVDITGKLLATTTVFPLAPMNDWHGALTELAKLAAKHHVNLISIGNGTGSRETERLVAELIKMYPDLNLTKIVVSEAGASVYSASELAALEFPDLDVTLRGAVSIARRLQDPLAELVKIEPKSIGVGQYQHDVNQTRLSKSLEGIVEDCVNAVGVDVNTASAALLTRVSGLNEVLAKNLVIYRDANGIFDNREALKEIPRMGDKTYQQAAGFLRILNGKNPLDASAVHPEAYALVQKILTQLNTDIKTLIGNEALLKSLDPQQFVDEQFGLPTVLDVMKELEKPGRDPRPEFKTATFKEGIEDIKDLQLGMIMEGVVSNVTNFGAFVDIGVHQDGLVHISQLTSRFVSDASTVVKAGDIVQVKVVEVDIERRRIGLSMRLDDASQTSKPHPKEVKKTIAKKQGLKVKKQQVSETARVTKAKPILNTAMADQLAKLKLGK